MNKIKQVSHSKQETVIIIFTHPSSNPSALQNKVWQYYVTVVHFSILVLKSNKANEI